MGHHLPKLILTARGNDALRGDHPRTPAADDAHDRFGDVNDLDRAPVLDYATLGRATRLQERASGCPRTPAPPDSMS